MGEETSEKVGGVYMRTAMQGATRVLVIVR